MRSPLPVIALLLSVLGIAGFIFLFLREFNIYWLILSPVIFVVYQFPAFAAFWLYKKRRRRREAQDASCPDWPEEDDDDEAAKSA